MKNLDLDLKIHLIFGTEDNCVVLVPSLPSKDLVDLFLSHGFKLIYKKGKKFLSIPEDFLD